MKIIIPVMMVLTSLLFVGCQPESKIPTGVSFQKESLLRQGAHGDNWCITWTPDNSQLTSMDDGNWLLGPKEFHNNLYRIVGNPDKFTREEISAYPDFTRALGGWFGYGVLSVDDRLYSMVSRTPGADWGGPFRGVKMLSSSDQGESWYRVNAEGEKKPTEKRLIPFHSVHLYRMAGPILQPQMITSIYTVLKEHNPISFYWPG